MEQDESFEGVDVPSERTIQEIANALHLDSAPLLKEVHDTVVRQVGFETGRQGRLDAKASALLTAAGLSNSVAFGFGGWLLAHDTIKGPRAEIAAMLFLAVCAGVLAAIHAVLSLEVRPYQQVGEDAVFSDAALKKGDHPFDAKDVTCAPAQAHRLGSYYAHMAMATLQVLRTQRREHARKAELVRRGQWLFVAFLVLVVLTLLLVVFSA